MKKLIIATSATLLLILAAILFATDCFGAFKTNELNFIPTATPTPSPTAPPTIVVPDDYPTISTAIEKAKDGYSIIVKNGTYTEQNLNINKTLTITSQHQNGAKIIIHTPITRHYAPFFWETEHADAIRINANNVTLSGFLISSDGGNINATGNRIEIINNNFRGNATISLTLNGNENIIEANYLGSLTLTGNNQQIKSNHLTKIVFLGNNNTISSNQVIGTTDVGIR